MPLVPPVTSATRTFRSIAIGMMTPGVGGRRWERQRPVGTRFLTDRQNLSRSAMPTTSTIHPDGIAEVVMDNPPVNALTVGGWFELARSEEHTSELQSLMRHSS